MLCILTETSWHCLSLRGIKRSFIYFVSCSLRYSLRPWLMDPRWGEHWLPVRMCVRVCLQEWVERQRLNAWVYLALQRWLLHDSFITCGRQVFITKILLLLWKSIDQIWPVKVFSLLVREREKNWLANKHRLSCVMLNFERVRFFNLGSKRVI